MGYREKAPSWELGHARVEMARRSKGMRVAVTWSQSTTPGRDGVGLPDLTNKDTGHRVKSKFQINEEYF